MDNKKKKILIHNKFYKLDQKISKDYCHNNNDVQSVDRLYSIIDQILSINVKIKNSLLNFFFSYWFFNNDFQKEKSLSNKKINKPRLLINIIFLISLIGLIICLIFGIAIPIIQSTSDSIKLLSGKFQGKLLSNNKIIGFVISQNDALNVVKEVKSVLAQAMTNGLMDLDLPNNLWIKSYLENYYMQANSLGSLQEGVQHLSEYLIRNSQSNPIAFVSFGAPMRTLTYFALVNSTLQSSELGILNTFKDLTFTGLSSNNIFYGLKSTSICLIGDQASQVSLMPIIWQTWFSNAEVIVPLCFTLLFLFIIWFHYRTIKKNKPKYTSMNMYNYVSSKVRFIKRFEFMLKKLVFLSTDINELKHNFILNFHTLDKTSTYNTLRLLNYAYSSIESMSVILVSDYDDKLLSLYKTIINEEMSNLAITVVDEETLQIITADKKVSHNGSKTGLNIVEKIDKQEMIYIQYRNYLFNYLDYWENNNEFNIFKDAFIKLSKNVDKAQLTKKQEDELIKSVKTNIKISQKNQIWNKTKISLKSFNPKINNLINEIIKSENEKEQA